MVPRWLVAVVMALFLAVITGGTWFFIVQRNHYRETAITQLSAIGKLKVNQISAWRKDRLSDAALLSESPLISSHISSMLTQSDPTLDNAVRSHLSSLRDGYGYSDVLIADTAGNVKMSLSGTNDLSVHGELLNTLGKAIQSGKPLMSSLYACCSDNEQHLGVVAPIVNSRDGQSKVVGAVVLINNAPRFLYPLVEMWPLPSETAETLLVARDGGDALILNELRHKKDTALKFRIPLTRGDVPAVKAVMGVEGIFEGLDYRGVNVLSVLTPIPDSPWYMVAKVDVSEVFQAWRLSAVLIIICLASLLIVLTSLFFVIIKNSRSRMRRMNEVRYGLIEYSSSHTLDELLTKALDEVGELVDSPIGFYHFVEADQKTLLLQQWSSRTLKEFCRAEARGAHYNIDKAGVWVDCVHQKKPVIHNDYASLPHKKGMPAGHAKVTRELVVPVMREGMVVAILGVGNKPDNYTTDDAEVVSYFADITWHLVGRKRDEEMRRSTLDHLNKSQAITHIGSWELDLTINKLTWSDEVYRIFGLQPQELPATYEAFLESIHPDDRAAVDRAYSDSLKERKHGYEIEHRVVRRVTGEVRYVREKCGHLRDPSGVIVKSIGTVEDVTERKKAQDEHEKMREQLNQMQKIDSVGRLAGGIAHDFNNMLGVIIGNAELALQQVDPDQPIASDLKDILESGKRAAELTRQLLTFARKQTIAPKVLDLNFTIEGMLRMLRRLIGENIDLVWQPETAIWPVKMDPSQIDQIMANLCVNAREAIDAAGKVTIETRNATVDADYCSLHPGSIPGDYVMLAVSDNGCGMGKDTLDKIFEPFFTTKRTGTGLGLSTIFGIVQQNKGFFNVYSEPGKGSTFKIYLPRHADEVVKTPDAADITVTKGHGELILVTEDDALLIRMVEKTVRELGYRVIVADSAAKAVELAKENSGKISLLITDVIMPEMNGKDLFNKLSASEPAMKCLYMSGYTANVIAHHGILDEGINFIGKPFTKQALADKIIQVIGK